jgi:hypothetical protein
MIYSSFALVALAAAAAIPPFGHHVPMHPVKQADARVQVTLINHSIRFHNVKVDGHSYEVLAGHSITIKAPAGTVIYRDSAAFMHPRGEVLVALTPEWNGRVMELK